MVFSAATLTPVTMTVFLHCYVAMSWIITFSQWHKSLLKFCLFLQLFPGVFSFFSPLIFPNFDLYPTNLGFLGSWCLSQERVLWGPQCSPFNCCLAAGVISWILFSSHFKLGCRLWKDNPKTWARIRDTKCWDFPGSSPLSFRIISELLLFLYL